MAWNSRISLVQVDETFTKFQFFKQLCPSWDLPLLFSVHEPKDFSCSCSGLERNPFGKKKPRALHSQRRRNRHPFGGKNSQPRLFRLWRWIPIRDRSELSSQGKKHWKSICYAQKCTINLLTNGDKRQSYKSAYLPRPTWDGWTISLWQWYVAVKVSRLFEVGRARTVSHGCRPCYR